MTETELKKDFTKWSGGFPPQDEHQIETYVNTAMPKAAVATEVRELLFRWLAAI